MKETKVRSPETVSLREELGGAKKTPRKQYICESDMLLRQWSVG